MRFIILAAAASLSMAPAAALAKGGPPANANAPQVDICHWSNGNGFSVITVNENGWLNGHSQNHASSWGQADHLAGDYWVDGDGDGYGAGAVEDCLFTADHIEVGLEDCNDADASINPGADEVCGDGIDNNCDGQVDENCSFCPCFTAEQIQEEWDEFQATTTYDWSYAECQIVDYDDYYYDYDYTQVYFYGENYTYPEYEYDYNYFYSLNYDDYGYAYCEAYEYDYSYNYETGENTYDYNSYWQYVTDEEHASCEQLLVDWSADNDLTCNTYTY